MFVILKRDFFVGQNRYAHDPAGGTVELPDGIKLPKDAEIVPNALAQSDGARKPIDSQEKHFRRANKEFDPFASGRAPSPLGEGDDLGFTQHQEALQADKQAAEALALKQKAIDDAEKLKALGGDKPEKAGKK